MILKTCYSGHNMVEMEVGTQMSYMWFVGTEEETLRQYLSNLEDGTDQSCNGQNE